MALTKCPECGEKISTSAEQCVHCGCSVTACPDCGMVFKGQVDRCTECGHFFKQSTEEITQAAEEALETTPPPKEVAQETAPPSPDETEASQDASTPAMDECIARWRKDSPPVFYTFYRIFDVMEAVFRWMFIGGLVYGIGGYFLREILSCFPNSDITSMDQIYWIEISAVLVAIPLFIRDFCNVLLEFFYFLARKNMQAWSKKNKIDLCPAIEGALTCDYKTLGFFAKGIHNRKIKLAIDAQYCRESGASLLWRVWKEVISLAITYIGWITGFIFFFINAPTIITNLWKFSEYEAIPLLIIAILCEIGDSVLDKVDKNMRKKLSDWIKQSFSKHAYNQYREHIYW